MESNTSKPIIELNSVTKIFGDKPEIALSLIDQGLDAERAALTGEGAQRDIEHIGIHQALA